MADHSVVLGDYELSLDARTGAIAGLRRAGSPDVLPGPARWALAADLAWQPVTGKQRYLQHDSSADEVSIQLALGPLIMRDTLRINGDLLERRVEVVNSTPDEVQLTGVRMALGGVAVGNPAACLFEAPGNTIRARLPLTSAARQPEKLGCATPQYAAAPDPRFAPGAGLRWNQVFGDAPDVGPGLMIVHNPHIQWSLLSWYVSDEQAATPWVTGDGTYAAIGYDLALAGWLPRGVTLGGGTQYIAIHAGDYASALDLYRDSFAATGLLPPIYGDVDRAADWIGVYETHPGMFGGFEQFTEAVPRIAELGIDTLYLMPIQTYRNKTGLPWDGNWMDSGSPYAIHDFERLEPSLGTEAEFRWLVKRAHDRGLRVLMDFVAQGSSLEAEYLMDYPEWYARDEVGQPVHSHRWNDTWSFDWANPEFHEFMIGWAMRFLAEYDIDGFRIDAPHGKEPNWDRGIPYHASHTSLGASDMLVALRQRMASVKPDSALLCELFGPLWIHSHDIANDYSPYAMVYQLVDGTLTPHDFNEYLRDYWAILPRSANGTPAPRIAFTETHDTRSGPAYAMRGSVMSRTLLGILVMAGFVPMIWNGQEKGQEDFIAGVMNARRESETLRRGQSLYNMVGVDVTDHYRVDEQGDTPADLLYTLLRYDGQHALLCLASLFPERITYRLSLPLDWLPVRMDRAYRLRDLITGEVWNEYGTQAWGGDQFAYFSLTPEMYRPYILLIEHGGP